MELGKCKIYDPVVTLTSKSQVKDNSADGLLLSFSVVTPEPQRETGYPRHGYINIPERCGAKFHQGHNQKTMKNKKRVSIKCTFRNNKFVSHVQITKMYQPLLTHDVI